jgi:hypothetical protein
VRTRFKLMVLPVSLVVLSGGCGDRSSDKRDSGASDAGTADLAWPQDLALGDLATGGACNTLSNAAPVVQQTMVNQPMPTPTIGGTIAPGTYYLTDSRIYQGAPPGVMPTQVQATQLISGSTVQSVQRAMNSANGYDTRSYSTSGTNLTITLVCGGKGTTTVGYDATATTYTTYNNAAKTVSVWTLH